MNNEEKILESLVTGGLIGAGLGALLKKENGEGTALGAIAGAVIIATHKAYQLAQESKQPIVYLQDGILYEQQPDGSKRFIKKIHIPKVERSKFLTLK